MISEILRRTEPDNPDAQVRYFRFDLELSLRRIPTREGLKWDHTSGMPAYDTASGDLDLGDYAPIVESGSMHSFPTEIFRQADCQRGAAS